VTAWCGVHPLDLGRLSGEPLRGVPQRNWTLSSSISNLTWNMNDGIPGFLGGSL
jgi:hypothetical protein